MHEVQSLFFTGERPWHGVGVELPSAPGVDKAFIDAGLTWLARLEPLFRADGTQVSAQVVIREDNEAELGIVKNGYTLYQNSDMREWIRPFVESGQIKLEVGGSLRRGKRVFMLGRIASDPIEIVPGDPVLAFLLFANGFDGTFAAHVGLTPIRVVCANTLAQALEDEGSKILRVFHTREIHDNLRHVAEIINIAQRNFVASTEVYQALSNRGMDIKKLKAFVRQVFFPKLDVRKNKDVKRVEEEASEKIYEKVVPLFEAGRGQDVPGVRGTWWAGINAVSEYLSYQRGKSTDTRVSSLWFGEASVLNNRALKVAVDMGLKENAASA